MEQISGAGHFLKNLNMQIGMRIHFESFTIGRSGAHVINRRHFHVHSIATGNFHSVQCVQQIAGAILKVGEWNSVNGKLEFGFGESNGQFELFVDEKWKSTVAFFTSMGKAKRGKTVSLSGGKRNII